MSEKPVIKRKRGSLISGVRWTISVLVVVTVLLMSQVGSLQAQQSEESPPLATLSQVDSAAGVSRTPGTTKLQGELDRLVEAYAGSKQTALQEVADRHGIKLHDDKVLIVIEGNVSTLPDQLTSLGGEIDSIADDRLSLLAPVSMLRNMAALEDIQRVRLPLPAVALAGSVSSEGVPAIGADAWHAGGHDGSGVTVAVIDFGFYNWQNLQASGDLPSGSSTVCVDYTSGSDCGNTDSDKAHGSACAEILYDTAPGIDTLYLYAFDDDADIANIVDHMIANGVDVASLSISWANGEPYDGSGPISQEVNRAKNDGDIFWAVAAGNQRQRHYEAIFNQGDCTWGHDFDETSGCANLNSLGKQHAGELVCIFLEWNDWPLTDQNYDLRIYRRAGDNYLNLANFWDIQDGDDPPVEGGCFTTPRGGTYYFLVDQHSASSDHHFEVFAWYDDFGLAVNDSSLLEPATADGAVTVAAFDYSTPTVLENFSSMGPRNPVGGGPFDPDACGPVPTVECKPDFSGPDFVSTVSYGSQGFVGTSAAAPHIAGAAALVKGNYPSYSPDGVYDYLRAQAPNPGVLSTTQDSDWGWGQAWLGAAPTGVELARLEAALHGTAIQVEWETATELYNLGFNLYRSDAPHGEYTKLNEALIPSQTPGSPAGAVYTWLDDDIEPGNSYYYKLEDMDIHGMSTFHGPVSVAVGVTPMPHVIYLPLVANG